MNRLPKQKQTQFILVALITLVVVGGLWYTLIRYQQGNLRKLETQRNKYKTTMAQIQETIKNSREIEGELMAVSNRLAAQEEDMASGDLYSSMVNTIRKFKQPYKVEIPQLTSGGTPVSVNLLPKFPYKQVSMSISGTATYYDLGRFVADFENRFPYSRVLNLEVVPASASRTDDREKLAFRMDIVSLVNLVGPRPASTP
jgi:Tfp pilus assembly protein PilO